MCTNIRMVFVNGYDTETGSFHQPAIKNNPNHLDAKMPCLATEELSSNHGNWIVVAVHHSFLERDNAVVCDVDMLRTHLSTAARYVAHP